MMGCSNDALDQPLPLSDEDGGAPQTFADDDCRMVSRGDWDALAAGYTEDAVRMPPGAPSIVGRTAIRRSLDDIPPITRCEFRAEQIDGTAHLAFMRASYDMTISPPDADTIRDAGKILIVFEKQPDGPGCRWRMRGTRVA